jgi:hypothetical protein
VGIGAIIWVGVKQASQTAGPGPCFNASCAITSLADSGTNLSLSVTNQQWSINSNGTVTIGRYGTATADQTRSSPCETGRSPVRPSP